MKSMRTSSIVMEVLLSRFLRIPSEWWRGITVYLAVDRRNGPSSTILSRKICLRSLIWNPYSDTATISSTESVYFSTRVVVCYPLTWESFSSISLVSQRLTILTCPIFWNSKLTPLF
jgi:hypothetical protein